MNVLRAEAFKFYWDIKRYLFNYLVGLIAEIIFIGGLYWTISRIGRQPELALIGLILWVFARGALSDASTIIEEERHLGTFERISLTKCSLFQILVARALVNFLFSSCKIVFLALALWVVFRPALPAVFSAHMMPAALLISILVIASLYAWGFLIASLQLVWKRVGAVIPIIEYIFLFFSGIIVPLGDIPSALLPISHLIPVTWGMKALQGLTAHDAMARPLFGMAVYALATLVISRLIFRSAIHHTKKTGQYGFY